MTSIIQHLNEFTLLADYLGSLLKSIAPILLVCIWICNRLELIRYAQKVWVALVAMAFRKAPLDEILQKKSEYICLWLEAISTSLGTFAYLLVGLVFLYASIYVMAVQPPLFPFRLLLGLGIVGFSIFVSRIFFVDFQFTLQKLFKSN